MERPVMISELNGPDSSRFETQLREYANPVTTFRAACNPSGISRNLVPILLYSNYPIQSLPALADQSLPNRRFHVA